jgi:hypothetical protein
MLKERLMRSNQWIVGILLFAFCVSLLMAALTTTKRIAIDRPSPSLKLRQSKASNEPGAVVAYRPIFHLAGSGIDAVLKMIMWRVNVTVVSTLRSKSTMIADEPSTTSQRLS